MTAARAVTPALLRRIPLPAPAAADDKDARGRVLAVGGSTRVPGAILLAGVAALRAGAGKLQLATSRRVAPALGVAVPESLVIALPETRGGDISGSRIPRSLLDAAAQADALLVGPGMEDDRATFRLLSRLVRVLSDHAMLLLDAAGVLALLHDGRLLKTLNGRAVLTPHAGEMASLLGIDKSAVEDDAEEVAREAARRFGAVVTLKGAESWIAEPDGTCYHYTGGTVGLATSGSGDALAGIVAGFAARGAPAARAAAWGVYVHGAAGRTLARKVGPIGFLARELLEEIPRAMRRLR
jgi:ADP-dependent NAD(P)H-hydrate dehydratase